MPPFTHEAQRWIWDRQNPDPQNCSTHKYYLGDNIKKQVLPLLARSLRSPSAFRVRLTGA